MFFRSREVVDTWSALRYNPCGLAHPADWHPADWRPAECRGHCAADIVHPVLKEVFGARYAKKMGDRFSCSILRPGTFPETSTAVGASAL
jgi:hypothetical protein